MPDEELLQLDVSIIQEERHRSHREIEGLERGPEIDEPVAPGDFEQAVPEVRLDQSSSSGEAGFFEARDLVEIQIGRLIAIMLQSRNHLGQVRRALVPV